MHHAMTIALLLTASTLFAGLEFSTSINDVCYRGPDERAGAITLRINDDDFAGASPETPIFMRFSFESGATLSRTLVDLTGEKSGDTRPIYLALRAAGVNATSLNAPPESVAIVRWVAGESAFWLRFQSDSSEWLSDGNAAFPPDLDDWVSLSLGITGSQSQQGLQAVPDALKNLPFNTRDPEANPLSVHLAANSIIDVDLSNSSLVPSGPASLLFFDPVAFDHTSEIQPGVYQPGVAIGFQFGCDCSLARAKADVCANEEAELAAHVTRPDGGFTTRLAIANVSEEPQTAALFGYNAAGEQLAMAQRRLEPKAILVEDAHALFGADVSHAFAEVQRGIDITAVYRATAAGSAPAHVRAATPVALVWRLFPGEAEVQWDGLAVVNRSDRSARIDIRGYDAAGRVLDEALLTADLAPRGKIQATLDALFEDVDAAYYEIVADQPISLLALRGDWSRRFLWQNLATPVNPLYE